MIDINLLRSAQKSRPGTPASRKKPLTLGLFFILACVAALAAVFIMYGDIFIDTLMPEQQEEIQSSTVVPEQTPAQKPESRKEQAESLPRQPAAAGEKPRRPAWNYSLSMLHIDTYRTLTHVLSETASYDLITVSGDRIVAEIETGGGAPSAALQNVLKQRLPAYSFSYSPKGGSLQIWGTRKPEREIPVKSVDSKSADVKTQTAALYSLIKKRQVSVITRAITGPVSRNDMSVYSGRVKLSGSESRILRFLQDLQAEGLSINILKISGTAAAGESRNNPAVQLFMLFEIIL